MGMMGEMEVLDSSGHTRHIWDCDNPAEIEAARSTFNALTGKGYRAFNVKKDGNEGTPMKTFDPEAEKMILVPPIAGG